MKQLLSEKTNRILELSEKLQQANETIQTIESEQQKSVLKRQPSSSIEESKRHESSNREKEFETLEADPDDEEEDELNYLRNKVFELEQARLDLIDRIELNKEKARVFLMQKDH